MLDVGTVGFFFSTAGFSPEAHRVHRQAEFPLVLCLYKESSLTEFAANRAAAAALRGLELARSPKDGQLALQLFLNEKPLLS